MCLIAIKTISEINDFFYYTQPRHPRPIVKFGKMVVAPRPETAWSWKIVWFFYFCSRFESPKSPSPIPFQKPSSFILNPLLRHCNTHITSWVSIILTFPVFIFHSVLVEIMKKKMNAQEEARCAHSDLYAMYIYSYV